MKKLCSLTTVIAMSITPATYAKEKLEYDSWVGGFIEYYNPDNDNPEPSGYLDEGHGFGGEVGFRFTPEWAVRLEVSKLNLDTDHGREMLIDTDDTGIRIGPDLMYFFDNDAYLFGGFKSVDVADDFSAASFGIGKHWLMKNNWLIFSELAIHDSIESSYTDFGVKLGLAYTFGGATKSSPVKDSDGDGVNDNRDQCPNTPAGTAVDGKGCDKDLDKDGVINSLDQCPDSPVGSKVDAKGCNPDLDGDGVLNAQDKCPNTPAGTPVGAKGCSLALDSDQDGVLDQDDKCANTPLTDKVDAMGCSVFTDKEVSVSLQVMFANNSADINNPSDAQFRDFAEFMQRFPNTQAVIEGHSSAVGEADYNQQLSERRANAVRQLLIDDYQVSASRLSAVGYGESRLLDDSDTAAAHRINRRIEAKVSAVEKVKEAR